MKDGTPFKRSSTRSNHEEKGDFLSLCMVENKSARTDKGVRPNSGDFE